MCDLLLLRSGEQTDAGDQAGKINKEKNWEEKVNELVSFVRSKSTTPRIDKRKKKRNTNDLRNPCGQMKITQGATKSQKDQQHVGSKKKKNRYT